jgi:hypothetical protein
MSIGIEHLPLTDKKWEVTQSFYALETAVSIDASLPAAFPSPK